MESNENELSYKIRGAAYKVHANLGPGLLESVYEIALTYELREMGLNVKNQLSVPMYYENIRMDIGFRLDIMVEDLVIVEVKSIDGLAGIHYKQLLTYLKLSDKKLGLLINFNVLSLNNDALKRVVNRL